MYPMQPRLSLHYELPEMVVVEFYNSVIEYAASIHEVACFPSLQWLKKSPQANTAHDQQPDETMDRSGIQILSPEHLSEIEI